MKKDRLILLVAIVLSACQSTTGNKLSVDYYQINGKTTADLDREIKQKGPKLGAGQHAIAVARIKMIPRIQYQRTVKSCFVESVKVDVDARITLPQWQGRKTATARLARTWDNVDRYARLHEATHVAIALKHSKLMETAILNQLSSKNCIRAKAQSRSTFAKMLEEHDQAQKQFDASEKSRMLSAANRKRS